MIWLVLFLPDLKSRIFWQTGDVFHSSDATEKVLQLVNASLYDEVGMNASAQRDAIFCCDSIRMNDRVIPRVGVGSDGDPFRVGVSCYHLLYDYLEEQRDPAKTTVIYVDTTFNIVRQRYPVSVVGYSDKGGHFFPIAYSCTSRHKEADISWFLHALKVAVTRTFGQVFEPSFVLMDGDNAQYNACTTELPSTTVLMCWYHVLTNFFKQCKARGVEPSQTALFFKELYDLHFAPRSVLEDLKRQVIARWDNLTPDSAAYGVARYIYNKCSHFRHPWSTFN